MKTPIYVTRYPNDHFVASFPDKTVLTAESEEAFIHKLLRKVENGEHQRFKFLADYRWCESIFQPAALDA